MEVSTYVDGLVDNATTSSDALTSTVTSPGVVHIPSIGHDIIGGVLIVTMAVGICTNSLGIAIFIKDKTLRSPTNLFIAGLALCDLSMLVVATPLPTASSFAHRWLWGHTGCVFEGFMVYFLGLTSLYLLCAISVDRYIVIALPLKIALVTKRAATLTIVACYGLGFFWAMLPLVGWNSYQLEGLMTSCSVVWNTSNPKDYSYNVVIFFTCLIFPIGVMVYCYYHVYMTWDTSSRIAKRNLEVERKISRTILVMIGVFIGSWTPYSIVSFWAAFGVASDIPVAVAGVPPYIAKTASVWNPIIYICTNKQFRRSFFNILPFANLQRESEEEQVESCEMMAAGSNEASVSKIQIRPLQPTDCHMTPQHDNPDVSVAHQARQSVDNCNIVHDDVMQENCVEQIHIPRQVVNEC
ncbi:Visual pigment-like receptor peropsin [Mizuhopecten yessoensis]|uniref:Visual pigment-like receptor peropsin n=1 Tax=Mizuhopecten yessoensis TaxID=6573 RepID=A0A210QHL3_MIZYE|nr:Visual pigment-like receptor peropsin [Mizuhopecten yessoensis]